VLYPSYTRLIGDYLGVFDGMAKSPDFDEKPAQELFGRAYGYVEKNFP